MATMGKLVTKRTKNKVNHLNHKYTNPTEVGNRIEVDIKVEVGLIMSIGGAQYMIRT